MELIQGVDVNFVMPCMLPGHVSKGPFQRYGVRRHLVNRARNDVLHKNKEKLFSICPAPYPRKSPTGPLQSTPHVVARGIVTGADIRRGKPICLRWARDTTAKRMYSQRGSIPIKSQGDTVKF